MARLSKFLATAADATAALGRVLRGDRRDRTQRHQAPAAPKVAPTADRPRRVDSAVADETSPGQTGPDATIEIDPSSVGQISMSYAPNPDGKPDPGEVVWTWVPFEENDGRGKDRPVLLVAAEAAGTVLGVQLTSKRHDGADFVGVGSGGWDGEHRPSWANLDRVIRVHPSGMRREGTALGHKEFAAVATRLAARYGWVGK